MNRAITIQRTARFLRMITYLLAAIGIAMVLRRILTLEGIIPYTSPAGSPPFDGGFARHPLITLIHILPGALFMILGPLQFMQGIRDRHIRFHRWSGRLFIISAYIVGLSAVTMPFVMEPIGGVNEGAGSVLFGIYFLVSLTLAWRYILKRQITLHREWMIRAFAIGLAVGTIRPIIGSFFAFSGLQPREFFGIAFWIGFTLHLIAAEVWINCTREYRK